MTPAPIKPTITADVLEKPENGSNRDTLHYLIDRLPDAEIPAAQRFLAFLAQEPVGTVFGESIRRGIAQADAGESIVCQNYDDMVEKLPGKE
jgi:hypothetical protein